MQRSNNFLAGGRYFFGKMDPQKFIESQKTVFQLRRSDKYATGVSPQYLYFRYPDHNECGKILKWQIFIH